MFVVRRQKPSKAHQIKDPQDFPPWLADKVYEEGPFLTLRTIDGYKRVGVYDFVVLVGQGQIEVLTPAAFSARWQEK